MLIAAESVILFGATPASLGHSNIVSGSLTLRARHPSGSVWSSAPTPSDELTTPNVTYVEGVDYVVDYAAGTVARLSGSGIPDSTGIANPRTAPDGRLSLGNVMVWATYTTSAGPHVTVAQSSVLPRLLAKLTAGSAVSVMSSGDSITAGGEAENTADIYVARWLTSLAAKYGSAVSYVDHSVSGWPSAALSGSYSYRDGIFTGDYDLVVLAYGMNDQYQGAQGDGSTFKSNVLEGIDYYRASHPNAEFILVTTVNGNPAYGYPTASAEILRTRLQEIAAIRSGVFVADALSHWNAYRDRKGGVAGGARAMFRNDVNHPTSFGHWIWSLPLAAVEPPPPGRSVVMPYGVSGPVGRPLGQPYLLTGRVNRSLAQPYVVTDITPAGRSLGQPADVRGLASGGLPQPYSTSAIVGRSAEQSYSIPAITLSYATDRRVGPVQAVYATLRRIAVGPSSPVGRSLAQSYPVSPYVDSTLALPYGIRQLVGLRLDQPYAVKQVLGRSLPLRFSLVGPVGHSLVMRYNSSEPRSSTNISVAPHNILLRERSTQLGRTILTSSPEIELGTTPEIRAVILDPSPQ